MRQIDRLGQLLRLWEDRMFAYDIQHRLKKEPPKNDPIAAIAARAPSLRRYLHDTESIEKDPQRMHQYMLAQAPTDRFNIVFNSIPFQLALWMADSRRGFRLTRDMQAVLNATSLKSLTWGDVMVPYGAFAVGLEEPIANAKGHLIDTILMTLMPVAMPDGNAAEYAAFRLLGRGLEEHVMSPYARSAIMRQFENARTRNALGPALQDIQKSLYASPQAVFLLRVDTITDLPVADSVTALLQEQFGTCPCGKEHPEYDQVVRLVVGMCMYLHSLPEGSELVTPWKPAPNAVLSGAQSCTVHFKKPLTSDQRKVFFSVGRMEGDRALPTGMGVKFVPGHWRRPPRRKDDGRPDERVKSVQVDPSVHFMAQASTVQREEMRDRLDVAKKEWHEQHPKA